MSQFSVCVCVSVCVFILFAIAITCFSYENDDLRSIYEEKTVTRLLDVIFRCTFFICVFVPLNTTHVVHKKISKNIGSRFYVSSVFDGYF